MTENENKQNMISKFEYKFAFKPDDWFLDVVFKNSDIRYRIFIVKNYNYLNINSIIFDIYNLVKVEREKLESQSSAFIHKKEYLTLYGRSAKIQMTLEDEYALKELIEQYKAYELIGWLHLGKNDKIFRYCVLRKQEILKKIYPIADLSIRKVIGAKVISPVEAEFEDAVNNAWLNIIKYLPKIDTSRVMFSIFVKIAHKSAIRYKNSSILVHKYNCIRMSDLISCNDSEDDIAEDVFLNTVMANNPDIEFDIDSAEEVFLNEIDDTAIDYEQMLTIDSANKELDNVIDSLENPDSKQFSPLMQTVLSYSYNTITSKAKQICYEKIFAEFFIDLVNQNISENLILKHTPIMLDVINAANTEPVLENDEENNSLVYKMFKDWIKDKIKYKIATAKETKPTIKYNELEEYLSHERAVDEYLKNNKKSILVSLLDFKRNCNKLKF